MRRALLLNSGLAWAAYQAGALRHLVIDRRLHFDLCAGSGLGALNAALVACGELEALDSFWRNFSWRRLASVNWRSPWRDGPLQMTPLRKFIAAHVDEKTLQRRGAQLLFSCLDVNSGLVQSFHYPGCEVPLQEALVAAISLPGLAPPLRATNARLSRQWVEATMVESFMMRDLLHQPLAELWVIAATLPQPITDEKDGAYSRRVGQNWRAAVSRVLQLNQAQDVRDGLDYAQEVLGAAAARRGLHARISTELHQRIADPQIRSQLARQLQQVYEASTFPWKQIAACKIQLLIPSSALQYSPWRFRSRDIRGALTLGYTDAQALLPDIVEGA